MVSRRSLIDDKKRKDTHVTPKQDTKKSLPTLVARLLPPHDRRLDPPGDVHIATDKIS